MATIAKKDPADYLSDIEKQKIQSFLNDSVMLEAVRKVLLFGINHNGTFTPGEPANPARNFALQLPFQSDIQGVVLDDATLGAEVRAQVKGIRLLENGFAELKNCVPSPKAADAPAQPNKAY